MEELTWALRCAQVGIKGGALLLVATCCIICGRPWSRWVPIYDCSLTDSGYLCDHLCSCP